MRIDKFLKVSRITKRREIAKKLCDDGDVLINDKVAKPSAEIKEGDVIFIKLGRHRITAKIKSIKAFANKETANQMFEIIKDEITEREQYARL